jgi:transposase
MALATCEYCGEGFETTRPDRARFCPAPKLCRQHASQERTGKVEVTCSSCGEHRPLGHRPSCGLCEECLEARDTVIMAAVNFGETTAVAAWAAGVSISTAQSRLRRLRRAGLVGERPRGPRAEGEIGDPIDGFVRWGYARGLSRSEIAVEVGLAPQVVGRIVERLRDDGTLDVSVYPSQVPA